MDDENLKHKKEKSNSKRKQYFYFFVGLIIVFLLGFFLNIMGLSREGFELCTAFIVSYILLFTGKIILKEFSSYLVSSGLFLLSLTYLFDGIEELVFFKEDGFVDLLEDYLFDYCLLISFLMICFGFIKMLDKKNKTFYKLKQSSLKDPLTGIYNRRALFQLYGDKNIIDPVTFCYIDLDNFKEINDKNGHQEGDVALKKFTDIITSHKRPSDYFFRIGGDEFVLVINTLDTNVAGDIIKRFNSIVKKDMEKYKLDFTYGFVPVKNPISLEEILKESDNLMYKNKTNKK